mmetsp:Transcript_43220/g.92229  ORF Transcript_43220/g.92229 Transcript_43220/m.92229 type:complete len:131 (+) Transcript_43220:71-463(+)
MVKCNSQVHDLMMRGGFEYDQKKDRYFFRKEAEWDVEKRIEKGRRQYAVPCKTLEEFAEGEEKMVDALLERLKAKAKASPAAPKEEVVEEEEEEAPAPKKRKASVDEEEEPAPKKKKKKKEVVEEEEEEA